MEAVAALEGIGSLRMADIVNLAIARFPDGQVPKDRDSGLELVGDAFPSSVLPYIVSVMRVSPVGSA